MSKLRPTKRKQELISRQIKGKGTNGIPGRGSSTCKVKISWQRKQKVDGTEEAKGIYTSDSRVWNYKAIGAHDEMCSAKKGGSNCR